MSVERIRRKSGPAYRVRWRESGRNRARTFDARRDAELFEGEIRRRRQLGELANLDAGKEPLDDYVTETWGRLHLIHLAPKTRKHYAALYDLHVSPYLGQTPLREITPELVARWTAERVQSGAGRTALRHAFVLLASILEHAVTNERIFRNPAKLVKKPAQPRRREVRPIAPAVVERMRGAADARDAALLSVLAYAGLRPGEALALRWGDVGSQTLLIERALSLGEEADTKTRRHRTVRLLPPLKTDLATRRLASGRSGDDKLVFPGVDGKPWTEPAYQSWRRRAFRRACEAAGLEKVRPYDLRHSFASLLLHEGRSPIYVAKQLGHAPRMTLGVYGHVIDEFEDAPELSAEDAIRAAREGAVPGSYPKAVSGARAP